MLANLFVDVHGNMELEGFGLYNLEEEYRQLFGIERVVWISGVPTNDRPPDMATFATISVEEEGQDEDDIATSRGRTSQKKKEVRVHSLGTGGHVDEMARFLTSEAVVVTHIGEEDVQRDETGLAAIDAATFRNVKMELLRAAAASSIGGGRSSDKPSFEVVDAPGAPIFVYEMDPESEDYQSFLEMRREQQGQGSDEEKEDDEPVYSLATTSYMNYVVTNLVVLVPEYYVAGDPFWGQSYIRDSDLEMAAILRKFYPDRTVRGVNPLALNFAGGGMHCITAHQPV